MCSHTLYSLLERWSTIFTYELFQSLLSLKQNGHVMEVEVMLNIAWLLWYNRNQRWVGDVL